MPGERYKHIFLQGPSQIRAFTSPHQGGNNPNRPTWNRQQHSQHLRERFESAWNQAQRQAVTYVDRRGCYIQFASEPGFQLALGSLENLRSGIRLLSVKRSGEPGSERTLATVFVPNNQRSFFLKRIRDYAERDNKISGQPRNAGLIDSISDIRLAVLESFWQDDSALLPSDERAPVEVWLSSDRAEVAASFEKQLSDLRTPFFDGILKFPERSIMLVHANGKELENLVEASDHVAELRPVPFVPTALVDSENKEQLEIVSQILARSSYEFESNVAVCILDTGVNSGHQLIHPLLDQSDLHAAHSDWGTSDDTGHGTLMAGVSAYGDLLDVANNTGPISVHHKLESAKILPPPPSKNAKELWGYFTAQGLARAEIQAPDRKRVVCMAIASSDDRKRGRPSSWSAEIDSLVSGAEDENRRLFLLCAGNVSEPAEWLSYPKSNMTSEVHDPAQAWNALTVGAFTRKTQIASPLYAGYSAIAPDGGLSPYSSTSNTWPSRRWPIKPEIVLEGGNAAADQNGSASDPDDLKVVSTYYKPTVGQFASFCATSAATAEAARIAAQIQVAYSAAWPETIRGLMIHSSEWTDTLKKQFLPAIPTKGDWARLLRTCGYGVPNLETALYCASNSLTMISQAELQPFDRRGERFVTRDMHLYSLPWPATALSGLGELEVSMRVTLSYFVEPSPGEVGWENRYRYASHGLRFEVNGPSESEDEFVSRVNDQARDDGESPGTKGPGDRWVIGTARNVGSIHSDIWQGTASDLAASSMIAVYPTAGWWRDRHHLGKWNKKSRYSLIVSIHTPAEVADIYTPVIIQMGIPVEIQVSH